MKIYIISIFPEIYKGFIDTSLIKKGIKNKILNFELINPREFCLDNQRQVDDEIYGGGVGMLLKAKPFIDAINFVVNKISGKYKILYLSPSKNIFNQKKCLKLSKYKNLIFVCGRYEGIDFRFEQYCKDKFQNKFQKISIGKYILMGGEVASMVLIESICRFVDGVVKEKESLNDESYNIHENLKNIEYPQFTRPENVYGFEVPKILLSGNHGKIQDWKKSNKNYKI